MRPAEVLEAERVDGVRPAAGIEHEAREHRVVATPASSIPAPAQHLPVVLDVVAGLRHRRILQQRHQRAPRRDRRAAGGSSPAPGRRARRAGGRWPNGRYQTSVGLAASERPTSSASWGSSELVSVSRPPAARRGAARPGPADRAGSSTTMTSSGRLRVEREPVGGGGGKVAVAAAASAVRRSPAASAAEVAHVRDRSARHGGAALRHRGPGVAAGGSPCPPSRRASEKNSSSVRIRISAVPIGLAQDQVLDVELDRHVALDGDQLLRQPGVVGLRQQRLAGALGRDLRRRGPGSSRDRRTRRAASGRPSRRSPSRRACCPSVSPTSAR